MARLDRAGGQGVRDRGGVARDLRVIGARGETLAPPPFVTDALATLPLDQHRVCAALDAFLEARTVVAVDGGAPLVSARFARVEPGTAVVAAVLADGRTPAPSAKKVAA